MATSMQVILTTSVEHLGRAGELVKVKPGYARNYLLPRSMAVVATRGNIKHIEHERRLALARSDKERKIAEGHAAQLENLTVEIPMSAGDGERLFGSVTSRDVADALANRGIDIDRKKLEFGEAIKTLGEHTVTVKFAPEIAATFKINVVRA